MATSEKKKRLDTLAYLRRRKLMLSNQIFDCLHDIITAKQKLKKLDAEYERMRARHIMVLNRKI